MKVLYNYYYLFYTKVLPDDEPFATTLFTLSCSESFLIDFLIRYFLATTSCQSFETWKSVIVFGLILGVNFLIYHKNRKAREIVDKSPKFLQSHALSISATLIFFSLTTSFLFWGPIYIKSILDKC